VRVHGAWREGNDYTTGSGRSVPADFRSRELRGTVGYRLAPGSQLAASLGYQNQVDIDYPGRMMNADSFDAVNASARWSWQQSHGLLREAQVLGYYNTVEHGMDNEGKPTAQPDPSRMPPFALNVEMPSSVDVIGGRMALKLDVPAAGRLEIGTDVYSALRSASRTVRRRDTGALLRSGMVWPDARITDAGLFTRMERTLGPGWQVAGTTRLDVVQADAGAVSNFFRTNVSSDLSSTETNVSAALTLSVTPATHWSLAFGVGSTARTADATERYADRLPTTKAQISAEFVGNPSLDSERNTQADVWLDAEYSRWSLSLNAFARRIDDYITLRATSLSPRMGDGPSTVYEYANGSASFYGGEASTAYRLADALTARLRASYLWGRDHTVEEPAFGVAPLQGTGVLRYEPADGRYFVEGVVLLVDDQDRVATTRGETRTDGYATFDVKGRMAFSRSVALRLGVTNLTDVTYVNHLNAVNPYTGVPLAEPGREFFADLTVTF
jgi:iron complex outermembrane receptor protein